MSETAEHVVVVGGGHAGIQTALSLRERGWAGRVTVLSADHEPPYERPPLSKGWLKGAVEDDGLAFRPAATYAEQGIEVRTGVRVERIERAAREVRWAGGALQYDHLVLALGARPRRLPVAGADLAGVHALHTHSEALALRAALDRARSVVVIGAGFIGLEVAAEARRRGRDVVVVEAGERVMQRALTPLMSCFFADRHRAAGADLAYGVVATELLGREGRVTGVRLSDGRQVSADLVVTGIGVEPSCELAREAGLHCSDGVVVDEYLRTDDPRISAIGDCASFPVDQRRIRLESVQNAVDQARLVAARLTGEPRAYREVPWFWTDQHGGKLQMAGLTADSDTHVVVGSVDDARFTVLCWRAGVFVGGESVNRPGDHITVRRLLADGVPLDPAAAAAPGFELKTHLRHALGAAA